MDACTRKPGSAGGLAKLRCPANRGEAHSPHNERTYKRKPVTQFGAKNEHPCLRHTGSLLDSLPHEDQHLTKKVRGGIPNIVMRCTDTDFSTMGGISPRRRPDQFQPAEHYLLKPWKLAAPERLSSTPEDRPLWPKLPMTRPTHLYKTNKGTCPAQTSNASHLILQHYPRSWSLPQWLYNVKDDHIGIDPILIGLCKC